METAPAASRPKPHEPPPPPAAAAASATKVEKATKKEEGSSTQAKASSTATPEAPPTTAELKTKATFLQKIGLKAPPATAEAPKPKADDAVTFMKKAYATAPSPTTLAAKEAASKKGLTEGEQKVCKVVVALGVGHGVGVVGAELAGTPGKVVGTVVGHFAGEVVAEAVCDQPIDHATGITDDDARALAEKKKTPALPDATPPKPNQNIDPGKAQFTPVEPSKAKSG